MEFIGAELFQNFQKFTLPENFWSSNMENVASNVNKMCYFCEELSLKNSFVKILSRSKETPTASVVSICELCHSLNHCCFVCFKSFKSLYNVKRHCGSCHSLEYFSCHFCHETLRTPNEIHQHLLGYCFQKPSLEESRRDKSVSTVSLPIAKVNFNNGFCSISHDNVGTFDIPFNEEEYIIPDDENPIKDIPYNANEVIQAVEPDLHLEIVDEVTNNDEADIEGGKLFNYNPYITLT